MVEGRVLCRKNKLIPDCPPQDELELTQGAPEYFLYAQASHETYKATYDCLIGGNDFT